MISDVGRNVGMDLRPQAMCLEKLMFCIEVGGCGIRHARRNGGKSR